MPDTIVKAYRIARDRYAAIGVNTNAAIAKLGRQSVSIQCWQGDDVGGFERTGSTLGGGLQVTGNHPGRARNADELRADLAFALSLIPGRHAANIHAMYGDFGGVRVDRDAIETRHFSRWIDWAKKLKIGLDFNATCFAHPKAESGFTLSNPDPAIRKFWIEHVARSRTIAAAIGKAIKHPTIHNLWIPDGTKDACVDRAGYRTRLVRSLDDIYRKKYSSRLLRDAVEAKLFGIGSESFVVGSHEFYMGYAITRNLMVCLDMGHFHPTESVADKVSSLLQFSREMLVHVSRGVRWDSDHVVLFDDATRDVAHEIVRARALDRVHLAMDYFDASINRIGAWVIGARATLKALLYALVEPTNRLVSMETDGNLTGRLGLLEELKSMPFGAVWDYYCQEAQVPVAGDWLAEVARYERQVLDHRES